MDEGCSFCHQPCVINCMNRSLYHKHNEQEDKRGVIIDKILSKQKSSSYIKYVQTILQSNNEEYMIDYLKGKPYKEQMNHLKEYYKFRIYVPLFSQSRASDAVLTYYYQKLKHYYNNIKRKLHITIDPSSSSEITSSVSQSNISTKEELLKEIKYQIQLDKKKRYLPNIINYKSQSKALEELVSYMKINSHFQEIKTLKTEDCFNEQQLFQQTIKKKSNQRIIYNNNEPLRSNIKSKLFKKVLQNSQRKTPIHYETNRQRPPSRSKSIKFIKLRDPKQIFNEIQKPSKPPSPFHIKQQQILKDSRAYNSLNKKHSSLGKLNHNHYTSPASPYRKKSLTKQKIKVASSSSIPIKFKNPINDLLKTRNDERIKLRESISKIQTVKFHNQAIKNKTTPNSPSSRKIIKSNVQILKNDNILSIKKKKLQILKQKVHKK